jgi:MFS family permease
MSHSSSSTVQTDALTRLDNLPWTRFHTLVTVALGVGWALDSFETNIIGSMFGVIKAQWRLSALQSSLAVTAWMCGMLIGAIGFGYLADRFGRKRLFLATLLWYAAFSLATVLSWNYESFLFFRIMTAMAVGGEYSAVTAAMGELIPKSHRGRTDALILSGFPLGALFSAGASWLLITYLPPEWSWRVGFGLGTTLAVIFLWIRRVVPESPRWLLQHGRVVEVEALVERIAEEARKEGYGAQADRRYIATSFTPERPDFVKNLRELGGKYRWRCALASAFNFSQATVVYGVLTLMGLVVLPYLKVPASDVPLYYLFGNLAALLGGLTAAQSVDAWGRRRSLFVSYSLTVLAILPLCELTYLPYVVLCYCVIQFGVTWAYISAYVVSSEVLPTSSRATGLGVSVAVGRAGAMASPFLLTSAYQFSGTPFLALVSLFALAIVGPIAAALWWRNGPETRNISLEEGSSGGLRSYGADSLNLALTS